VPECGPKSPSVAKDIFVHGTTTISGRLDKSCLHDAQTLKLGFLRIDPTCRSLLLIMCFYFFLLMVYFAYLRDVFHCVEMTASHNICTHNRNL